MVKVNGAIDCSLTAAHAVQTAVDNAKLTREYYGQGGILGNPALSDRFVEMLRQIDDLPFELMR
jgi:hypothetical protein